MKDTHTYTMQRRFTRRIVKKAPLCEDPMPEWDPEPDWEPEGRCMHSKTKLMEVAGGGGGGGSAAGAGGQAEARYGYLPVTKMRTYVPPSPPTPEMLLHKEKAAARAALDHASARASESFMAAATARNGNDYNANMDRHAVHQAECIRLHNILDDIEWRIIELMLA